MGLAETAFRAKLRTVRRDSASLLTELTRNERLPREEIMRMQAVRAAEIARFAAQHTEFYRRLFDEHSIDLARLEDPEEWARIPVIDRATVKANIADITSTESGPDTAEEAKTGGSTGEPLRTLRDRRVPTLSLAWRMYRWWGVEPWDHLARVGRWGFGWKENLKNAVTWWPSRQVYLDASLITEASMEKFHRTLSRTRPALIEGYVGAMLEFADFLDRRGLSVPSLRAVATTAAPLVPATRARLEAVYHVPVYDEYRGSEINWIAGECAERDGLHVSADVRRVEVVGPDGRPLPAGEVGDLVITDLTNRVFPLLRYRVGDRGALRDGLCACGRTLPLMEQVEGRLTDIVRLPDGSALNHLMMAMFSDHPESVRIFQVRQHADHSIVVKVVVGEGPDARSHIETAVAGLRNRVAGAVTVDVEYVDALPYTGGKTKYVISDVPART